MDRAEVEDDEGEARGREDHSGDVEACGGILRLGDEEDHRDAGGRPDRHVDEEGPAPREVLGEKAAEQGTERGLREGEIVTVVA